VDRRLRRCRRGWPGRWAVGGGRRNLEGGVPHVGTSTKKDGEVVATVDDGVLTRRLRREQVDGAPQSRERKTTGRMPSSGAVASRLSSLARP
jgi:hypothetical protein